MKLKILDKIDLTTLESYDFLFLPWRTEQVGSTIEDFNILHNICFDLLILDFNQILYNFSSHNYLELPESLGGILLNDKIKTTALNLRIQHFTRMLLLNNLEHKNCESIKNNLPKNIYGQLSNKDCVLLLSNYYIYLSRWIYSPLFFILFSLKYKTQIKIPEKYILKWTQFKSETLQILTFFSSRIGKLYSLKAMYFWLTRLNESNLWSANEMLLKNISKSAFNYDDLENNRVFTYADYFDSILGAQIIREFGHHLYFPTKFKNKIKTYDRNVPVNFLDSQIYDRTNASLKAIHKSEKKKKILINSTSNANNVTNSEFLEIFKFLKHYSSAHFMGHICELFGFIQLALTNTKLKNEEFIIIPGSAIRIKSKNGIKQGPDGLIASIVKSNKEVKLVVAGIIEMKSYRISLNKIQQQIQSHRLRMENEKIQLIKYKEDLCNVFAFEDDIDKNEIIEVDKVTFTKNLESIAIVPSYKRDSKIKQEITLVELPWLPLGFKKMGLYFFLWIVQNFGRIGAELDYNRGISNWVKIMKRILDEEVLSKRNKNEIVKLLQYFKQGIKSVDCEWIKIDR